MTDFAFPGSIAEAAARLRAGELTAVALAERCLARILEMQPRLNAFITVTAEQALATARSRDAELRSGRDRGPLHGIPIAHKDCYDTAGIRTTVGADIWRERVPHSDAAVVRRLAAAGAVMLGKTQMNEFAAGMSGRNPFFGDARNPWDTRHAPGGSSSGSACAVAAGLCLGASGTDAGGSIRLPAAWTGIVGLRPTFGRVSTTGAYPRSHSFDCAGPLAACVPDAALLLQAMVEPGSFDPAPASADLRGIRLGIVRDFSLRDVDDDVAQALQDASRALAKLGAKVQEVRIPVLAGLDYGLMLDILLYEFHQVLGVEYRAAPDREKRFGPVVRANLERGAAIGAEAYRGALAVRERFVAELRAAFATVDALLTPTAPMIAPSIDAPEAEFDRARQFTIPFSAAGLPAISVRCGLGRAGLPVGLQIVADRMGEALVLQVAAACESAVLHPAG